MKWFFFHLKFISSSSLITDYTSLAS